MLFDTLKGLFFPKRCPFCGEIMKEAMNCCEKCEQQLPYVREGICLNCGNDPCCCNKNDFCFDKVIVPFYYDLGCAYAIKQMKFHNKQHFAKNLSFYLEKRLKHCIDVNDIDIVTAVPMCSSDKKKRGYNQSEELAKELAKRINKKSENIIVKKSKTRKQHSLNRAQRQANLKDCFKVLNGIDLTDKTILLCDDVITTGSTLNECSIVLKKNGVKTIICATIGTTSCIK
jgi:ComF family protein